MKVEVETEEGAAGGRGARASRGCGECRGEVAGERFAQPGARWCAVGCG